MTVRTTAGSLAEALASPAAQQPRWPRPAEAKRVVDALARMPVVVTRADVNLLGQRLAAVARGEAHVVRLGDCAETFADSVAHVRGNVRLLTELADALAAATRRPVVRIGRLAGQHAKPRSAGQDALGLPSYRGDAVNSLTPTVAARTPDPTRMTMSYLAAAATVRRAVPAGVYVSHEMLLLDYERAFLREAGDGRLYDLSAHALWIGERTRAPDGAHVRLAALIENPIGVKISSGASPDEVAELVQRLDPHRIPGRLTLISRMGHRQVRWSLPPVVERVARLGHPVVWECDPMHGNTVRTAAGIKTRRLDHVLDEVRSFFEVHYELGTHPGGLHIEATGDDVAECAGGPVAEHDVGTRYTTACDPRLNADQTRLLAEELTAVAAPRGPHLTDRRG